MQRDVPSHNFLSHDPVVHISPDGSISMVPHDGHEERTLPTVNRYTGPDGGYIAVYSRNKEYAAYSVGDGIFVVGQIRMQGQYVDGIFVPKGYEGKDISADPDLKALCDATFPESAPCWAGGDTGGWFGLRIDRHDPRDKIAEVSVPDSLPESVDLRAWCSPVTNQGKINACTAHAAAALVEFIETRARGKAICASPLFLYKVTRNLMGQTGDTGANTRSAMKALSAIGIPPEQYYPYDEAKFDEEPPAFCYSLAARYRSVEYRRLDPKDRPKEEVLKVVKTLLSQQRPVMFGVMAYLGTWPQFATSDRLPLPNKDDARPFGAHNVAVVGYDDRITTQNASDPSIRTTGAFLIKNSYGAEWGNNGYGWIPYDYLLQRKTIDWWTIGKLDWLDIDQFG